MDQAELEALIRRYLDGACSPAEAKKVEAWYNKVLESQKPDPPEWDYVKLHREVLSNIHHHKNRDMAEAPAESSAIPVRRLHRYTRIAIVAATVLLVAVAGISGYYLVNMPAIDHGTDIAPGGNRATLTLSDGRMVELSEAYSEIRIHEGDIAYQDGTLLLNRDDSRHGSESELITQYQLATPNGGTYQVTLSDGSRVWLNAASSLSYPSRFDEGERIVELEGEAYFEVARIRKAGSSDGEGQEDLVPFKVRTAGQTIEVLGTAFNVSAYTDHAGEVTTLISGSVRVSDRQTQTALLLLPGEQAISQPTGFGKRAVDTQPYTAWKEGIFLFDETPLAEVMRQVARWYDVSIDYDRLPERQISGIVSRDQPLSSVLHSLAVTGNKFTLKERRLLFMAE